MSRLIEVQDARVCPSPLTIHSGDILLFRATGGRIRSGGDVIEMLGSFLPAILGDNGNILTPMGSPNSVLFRVHKPGRALIDVIISIPFHTPPQITALEITVEP